MDEVWDSAVGPARQALEAEGLGKRFRRHEALRGASFRIPQGRICALVGPNGAGKSTLLNLIARLTEPTSGRLRVFGRPIDEPGVRAQIAYLGQDKPLYKGFTVAETLRLGRELNPAWDQAVAERIVRSGDVPLKAKVGSLSGGQRTRVAFALAFGKRPQLLLLDEPMADLDPLARHEIAGLLMAEVVEHSTTVVMSSHLLSELEDMCDHLLLLTEGQVRLAGDIEELLPLHSLVTGVAEESGPPAALAAHTVVESRITGRQFTALIRPNGPLPDHWQCLAPSLEEVVLGYLRSPSAPPLMTAAAAATAG